MNTKTPAGEQMDQPVTGALSADIMAIVAHELRSPLTVARGYTQRLMMSWESLDDRGKLAIVARINTSISRLSRLVDDIALLSGSNTAEFAMMARPYLLGQVVQHAIGEVGARRGDRATSIIPTGEDIAMYGDEYRLEQVVIALLELAIVRSAATRPINLTFNVVGERAHIAITDSGEVLTAAQWDMLFGRTGSLSIDHSVASGALGLDLLLCDRLTRAMGGSLTAHNDQTMTTTITLDIPVSRS